MPSSHSGSLIYLDLRDDGGSIFYQLTDLSILCSTWVDPSREVRIKLPPGERNRIENGDLREVEIKIEG